MELPLLAALPPTAADAALEAWWGGASAPHDRPRVAVAFSGGADSTALLVAQVRWQLARGLATPITALHVHHGLQPAADGFVEHCRTFCDALARQAPLSWRVEHVQVLAPPGASVEAAARADRYAALARAARGSGCGVVLLGHHADDQAETLLIALARGAGVAGLAAMPERFEREGMRFARPLLEVPARALREGLRRTAVPFVEDPTNDEVRFTRNRLRRDLMPALEAALPDFRKTFARSARLAAQAAALLDERAREDLQAVGDPPRIARLQALSAPRAANAVRGWLKARHGVVGSEAQLEALLDLVAACTTRGHAIHVKVGPGYVEREGDRLAYRPFL